MDLFFLVLWILSENYNTHETSKFNINICFIFQRKIFRNYFVFITRIFNGFQRKVRAEIHAGVQAKRHFTVVQL